MGTREIVFVTPVLPWPADQGSRQFQLEAARALATVGPVTWISRVVGEQGAAETRLREEGFDLRLDRAFASRSPWARVRRRVRIDLASGWSREPREAHFVSSPGVRSLVAAVAREKPDAWYVGAYWSTVRALERAPEGRRLLLAADVESDAARRGLELGGASRRERERVNRLAKAEARAFAQVDDVLCLTDDDVSTARRLLDARAPGSDTRIGRWPVGLPMAEPCAWPPPTEAPRLLLYGHWAAAFNRDGLEWFVGDVWPAIRRAHPSVTLRVVGRGAESIGRRIDGVEWVGYVDDLRPELERAHGVVIPLRYAGGLRYRLIEALASGRPVVCTPVAAAGAEAEIGRTHLEAQTPDAWVDAVGALLDPARAASLRDVGIDWARTRHGIEASRARVRTFFADLEGRHA